MKEEVQNAMVAAIHEIAATSTMTTLAAFIDVIKIIREELVLTYMKNEYVTAHVWPLVRKDIDLTKSILNASTTFSLAIENVETCINEFANKAVSFTTNSAIVDDDIMGKSVNQTELHSILKANHWLFFLLYCSVHLYLVNQVGAMYIPKEGK